MIGGHLLLAAAAGLPSTLLNGLVAYWKLDGNSTDLVSGAGSTDTAITWAAGQLGQCAKFANASSSRIATPVTPPLGAAARTVACWVRLDAYDFNNRSIWGYGYPSANYGFGLVLQSGWLRYLRGGSVTAFWDLNGGPTGWLSVVLEYTGTTVKVTGNGGLMYSNVETLNTLSNNPFRMGHDSAYPGFTAPDASMDEVGVWNRVWTPAEHAEWFNAGAGKTHPF